MKSVAIYYVTLLVITTGIFLTGCKKEKEPGVTPIVSTAVISEITAFTAKCGGNVTLEGSTQVLARGIYYSSDTSSSSKNKITIDGTGKGSFESNLKDLSPGTTYYVKAYATNSIGTSYGKTTSFLTLGSKPSVATRLPSTVGPTSAYFYGTVNANLVPTVVTFEFGLATTYDNSVSAIPASLTGNTDATVAANATGLAPGSVYHFRIKATNAVGTAYSSDMKFTTPLSETLTDIDGNIYSLIAVGGQVWMKENLKVTKYRNGDLIGTTTSPELDISAESTPRYQWPAGGNESNVAKYGRFYTWYTVTDNRNICPAGWHIPIDTDWTKLTDYLTNNGFNAGTIGTSIGKSIAAFGWWYNTQVYSVGNDQDNNNSSGFTGLPAGYRNENSFTELGGYLMFWSGTETDQTTALVRYLTFESFYLVRFSPHKKLGCSVRCIKDN